MHTLRATRPIEAVNTIVKYLVEHKDSIEVNGLYIITNGKDYIPGTEVGKRIQTFIRTKCDNAHEVYLTKKLWQEIKAKVPCQKTGNGAATRYKYLESAIGNVMYDWYDETYPTLLQRKAKS